MYRDVIVVPTLRNAIPKSLNLLPSESRQVLYMLISALELDGEELDLEFQILNLLGLRVIIPDWLICDLCRLARILQCT